MNVENLLSTKERIRILGLIIFQTGPLSVNLIAKKLKLSKGLISMYMDMLTREGVVRRAKGKFLMNHDASFVKGIKVLLNISGMDTRIFKKYPFVKAVGLYGSCSKGENTEDSDVDLWICLGETPESKKAALAVELRKKIRNVKPLFLSSEKIKELRAKDELFYHALSFGSIALYGVANALEL
jgi:predicted nucleotidyltransferase